MPMVGSRAPWLSSAVLMMVWLVCARALEFEMASQTKCIYEEINSNVIVVGDFKAFHKDHPDIAQMIDIRVGGRRTSTRQD